MLLLIETLITAAAILILVCCNGSNGDDDHSGDGNNDDNKHWSGKIDLSSTRSMLGKNSACRKIWIFWNFDYKTSFYLYPEQNLLFFI